MKNNEVRIAANLKQIETLRTTRDQIAASWLSRGYEKTQEMCEAIGEQIVALYEEIDAIEAGETKQAGRSENQTGKADEIAVTPAELEAVKHLGWGREEIIKEKKRAARRRVAC